MHRPVVLAALALASAVAAQLPVGQVPALLPLVPPPVPHPAYAAQPLIDTGNPGRLDGNQPGGTPSGGPTGPGNAAPQPDTSGPKLAGRDLKKAVEKVASLRWFDDLPSARAEAAAHNKPILWIQALGDLEGFA